MGKPRIAIVGLGLIGSSLGLALKGRGDGFEVVGHDRDSSAAAKSRKMGAVDRTDWNLINACEGAELVILALPLVAIRDTMAAIAPYVKPGSTITDTASLKGPVLAWAAELLPETVSFVGGDPILSPAQLATKRGVEGATITLFEGARYCLTPAPWTDPASVQVVNEVVTTTGAYPYFLDAVEHDGLVAWTDHLPAALSAALMQAAISASSWSEMRRIAGEVFASATSALGDDAASLVGLLLGNAENVLRLLDLLEARLGSLHQMLEARDEEGLRKLMDDLVIERRRWMITREKGDWGDQPKLEMPTASDHLGTLLLGGGLMARQRRDRK